MDKRLIKCCWHFDPNERPDFNEITNILRTDVSEEVTLRPEPVIKSLQKEFDDLMHNHGIFYWERWDMWWELASRAFDDGALWWLPVLLA